MPALVLSIHGRLLREYDLHSGMLIGRSQQCDVIVPDIDVASIAYRVENVDDKLCFVGADGSPVRCFTGKRLVLGAHRAQVIATNDVPKGTQPLANPQTLESSFSLVFERLGKPRRLLLSSTPTIVGTRRACDVRLLDRTVSRRHCSIEVTPDGVMVRDLSSRNGTWAEGHRVFTGLEMAGSFRLRVGCTTLHIVRRGSQRSPENFIVESAPMLRVMSDVSRFAPLPYPVLVLGESGVGKEGIAQALHQQSDSRHGPFVAINAGSLSAGLIGSELFGHERGAFTGATTARRGAFQQAEGGTLFLDEIGELPLALQTRLLRVLETWMLQPVGADQPRRVNVRLISATNRQPTQMVEDGTLRRDLFHRLNRLVVRVPPLRERREDVLPMAELFLQQFSEIGGARCFDEAARAFLLTAFWCGNVRQLRNVVQNAAALSDHVVGRKAIEEAYGTSSRFNDHSAEGLVIMLRRYDGNVNAAARAAGIPRSTFRDRLRREREKAA